MRAVERAYRMANDRGAAFEPTESTKVWRSPEHVTDREIELE